MNVVRKAVQHKELLDRTRFLEDALDNRERYEDLVGSSTKMKEVFDLVESVSYSTATVLIQGESGTGKELVARATRAAQAMCAVRECKRKCPESCAEHCSSSARYHISALEAACSTPFAME